MSKYNQKKSKVQLCFLALSCFSSDIWPPQSRNLSLTARYSVCKIGVVLILTLTLALRCGAAYVKCCLVLNALPAAALDLRLCCTSAAHFSGTATCLRHGRAYAWCGTFGAHPAVCKGCTSTKRMPFHTFTAVVAFSHHSSSVFYSYAAARRRWRHACGVCVRT